MEKEVPKCPLMPELEHFNLHRVLRAQSAGLDQNFTYIITLGYSLDCSPDISTS